MLLRLVVAVGLLGGCPRPDAPKPTLVDQTTEVGRDGMSIRGIAGDAFTTYVSFASVASGAATSIVEARRGSTAMWKSDVAGIAGPIASTASLVAVSTSLPDGMRGQPGARVIAIGASDAAARWTVDVDANEWAIITSIAAAGDDIVIGGSFSGTLRIANTVVASAGKSDGFVAKIAATGQLAWLVRVGGPGVDAVQGVAAKGGRIAIAGTFMVGADLLGAPLETFQDKLEPDDKKRRELPYADGFVALLDDTGHRMWSQTFGGGEDETVAGVTLDAAGRVVAAATVRGSVLVNNGTLVAKGAADGLVAWWGPDGTPGAAVLVGGADFDGLRAIAAADTRVVIGGFFSGTLPIAGRVLSAGGGDDAFFAALDETGKVVALWQAGGDGREEVAAMTSVPGGYVAALAHTASASIGGGAQPVALPAPKDPMSGAAIVVRAVP